LTRGTDVRRGLCPPRARGGTAADAKSVGDEAEVGLILDDHNGGLDDGALRVS
jgi:hypothetical protein